MATYILWKTTFTLLVVIFGFSAAVDTLKTLRPEVKQQLEEIQKNNFVHEDDFHGSILEFVPKALRREFAFILSFELRLNNIDANAVRTIQQFVGLDNLNTIVIKSNLSHLTLNLLEKTVTTLDLSENQLVTINDDAFSGLDKLTRLYLHRNEISHLPNGIFTELCNLQVLNLASNNLNTVEMSWFPENSSLEYLFLSKNRILQISEASFKNLPNLLNLHLSNNNLQTLHEDAFKGLSSLNQLVLRRNAIQTLPLGIFRGLLQLSNLELQDNQIDFIDSRTFLTNYKLSNLHLNNNMLDVFTSDILQHLLDLQHVDVNGNQLVEFNFHKIHAKTIRLFDNKLTELQFNNEATHIKAQNNSINTVIVPENAKLYDLQVNGNKIQDLINITTISTLEALYIPHNGITCLSGDLYKLARLRILDLSHNHLTPLSFHSWSFNFTMASLTELWINGNHFSHLPTNFLNFFPQLKYLDIKNNPWNETFISEFRQKCLDRNITLIDSQNPKYSK